MAEMDDMSREFRKSASLDQLVYEFHRAKATLASMEANPLARMYKGTEVWQIAEEAPVKYEQAIKLRSARLCYDARLDMYKAAGLI